MERLAVAALVMTIGSGCSLYTGDGGSSGAPDAYVSHSEDEWLHEILPMLDAQCALCHSGSDLQGPAFLAGNTADEVRGTLLTFDPPVVDLQDPAISRILVKGAHEGPALTYDEQTMLINWLSGN